MWTPLTHPLEKGTKPYNWDCESVYQCTWFCYFRALSLLSAPTWFDRATKTGSYTNAKLWLDDYRDPWYPITDPNYKPVAGDILVYDGEYGHVIFCETDILTSEYRNGDPNSFRNAKIGDYKGVLLGVLHYPYQPVMPVERNENVNQIETTDSTLRIRTKPGLDGEIVGHVQLGYYNVLDEKENDGYTWYEIEKGRWVANITTKYLPSTGGDIIRKIEEYFNSMKSEINSLTEERNKYKEIVKEVHKLTEVE